MASGGKIALPISKSSAKPPFGYNPLRRVGDDASLLAKEFYPKFDAHDLINLSNHSIYLKLMIDGTPSRPFSASTLAWESTPAATAEPP